MLDILIVSARTGKEDKLKGLNIGADDYIEMLLCRLPWMARQSILCLRWQEQWADFLPVFPLETC